MIPDLPNPTELAIPAFVLLMLVEIWWVRRRDRRAYEPRDTLTSLALGLGSTVAGALTGGLALAIAFWVYQYRLFDIGFVWWAWPIAFVLDDFAYYWVHRLGHRVRWMWAAHVIHHSSQHYNLSTALRQTWTGFFTPGLLVSLPLFWLGFHPLMIAFCGGINLIYQFWIHTEAVGRFPRWFEAVFNTPSHHRVHHARNPKYLDANYAGTLIVWDRLFGSFIPEDDAEPAEYGLVKNLGTFNPLRVATHEYVGIMKDIAQRGLTLRQRLSYFVAPPGWSHDGSRVTSDELKRRDEERKKQNGKIAVRAAD